MSADSIVRHGLGTTEEGQKLLARRWGTGGSRTVPPGWPSGEAESQLFRMDNDQARDSLRYIWSFDDHHLLRAATRGSKTTAKVCARLTEVFGSWTNPEWVIGAAAVHAYERGIMTAQEMDSILG